MVALASAMPDGARVVLFCLIGLLLVILGFLVAFVLLLRRRPIATPVRREPVPTVSEVEPASPVAVMSAPVAVLTPMGSAEGVAVEAGETSLACPSCRRKYEGDLQFCPNDARRLVPAGEMIARARRGGGVCPRCRRAFDPGVRFCSHDASELVPVSLYEATQGRRVAAPTGVLAKICPQCRKRYDLAATFCGRDGTELRTLN